MVVSGAAASVARNAIIARPSAGRQHDGEEGASEKRAGEERLQIIPPDDQHLIDVTISKRVSRYVGQDGRVVTHAYIPARLTLQSLETVSSACSGQSGAWFSTSSMRT